MLRNDEIEKVNGCFLHRMNGLFLIMIKQRFRSSFASSANHYYLFLNTNSKAKEGYLFIINFLYNNNNFNLSLFSAPFRSSHHLFFRVHDDTDTFHVQLQNMIPYILYGSVIRVTLRNMASIRLPIYESIGLSDMSSFPRMK